jgi:hypothetical protein
MWEGVESLLHLDGRLARTVPALFVRPGMLGKDFLEGRIARHVPPFRMFLVALLIFIVSAEHDVNGARHAAEAAQARREATPLSPADRAKAADKIRHDAADEFTSETADAAKERDEAIAEEPKTRDKAEKRYQEVVARLSAARDRDLARADAVAAGKAPPRHDVLFGSEAERRAEAERMRASAQARKGVAASVRLSLAKAFENPEYYLMMLFDWAHRLVLVLLPIVAGFLSLLYVYKKKFYVYDHLITAMNFLSFLFLAYAIGFWLPLQVQGYWLALMLAAAPVNLFMTLRGAYGSSIAGAAVKAAVVWAATLVSFVVLLLTLMSFVIFLL